MGAVTTVMLNGGADIPTVNTLGGTVAAAVWQFMNNNASAGGTKGVSVEINCTMQLGISG